MTTTYRAVVNCDRQNSVKCYGLLTVAGDPKALVDQVTAILEQKGWLRSVIATETYDVCPACQAALAARSPR